MSVGSVMVSTTSIHEGRAGSIPSPTLRSIHLQPIPFATVRQIVVRHHDLHSLPGGTKLAFGTSLEGKLLGAITFGVGPYNSFSLVEEACPDDCLTLTRLWLSEKLPSNSESRVLSVCLRYLRKYTKLKFIITYADPAQGHVGTIYQATGWLYTGLSEPTPKFDIGDGIARHSRSLAHAFGSHSLKYLSERGLKVKVLPQIPKHRYVYFLDKNCRNKLKAPVLPYPKKETDENR